MLIVSVHVENDDGTKQTFTNAYTEEDLQAWPGAVPAFQATKAGAVISAEWCWVPNADWSKVLL